MAAKKKTKRSATRRAYLVESIPQGMEALAMRGVPMTAATLTRLVKRAQKTIDLTAMYWTLLPDPARGGAKGDEHGFDEHELLDTYGARQGKRLYDALMDAAARGVQIRLVESPGFSVDPETGAKCNAESLAMARAHPDTFHLRSIVMGDWYGGGIMHQKIWIFDGRDVYLGSANNDWKSFAQVKEMGLCVENDRAVAREMTGYFDVWWKLAGLKPRRVSAWDDEMGMDRDVPPWSEFVPSSKRAKDPLADAARARGTWEKPMRFGTNGAGMFLSGAPREVCAGGRTYDADGLAATISEAEEQVSIAVMDFMPGTLYGRLAPGAERKTTAWWPQLADAVIHAVTTNCARVRLLVSHWQHTSAYITPYLQALQTLADAPQVKAKGKWPVQTGSLEIRRFLVPGWDDTGARTKADPHAFPGHTRVNHCKYIVTDRRMNIGTSNMTWDYFGNTAGASLNTDDRPLVRKLQACFDRDWDSKYSVPLGRSPDL